MHQESTIAKEEAKPVVRLNLADKPRTEMGDGGCGMPVTVRLRAGVKPRTEMGNGGAFLPPIVRLHTVVRR